MAQRISLLILSWTLILQYIILDYINIILYYTIKLILYYMPHQRRTRNTNCKYLWVFSGPSPACSCHFVKSFRIPMPGLREHCIAIGGISQALKPCPRHRTVRFCDFVNLAESESRCSRPSCLGSFLSLSTSLRP